MTDSSPNPDFASQLWRVNSHDPLVALGHDPWSFATISPPPSGISILRRAESRCLHRRKSAPPRRSPASAQIRAAHATKPVQVFFSYFYDACVEPRIIDEIRALGIVTVNWFCNASYQLHLVRRIAPHYDWCLVPERFRLDDYRALGAHPIYCQEAANPRVYPGLPTGRLEFDIAFAGQCYADRPDILRWLREQGLDVASRARAGNIISPRWRGILAAAGLPSHRRFFPLRPSGGSPG